MIEPTPLNVIIALVVVGILLAVALYGVALVSLRPRRRADRVQPLKRWPHPRGVVWLYADTGEKVAPGSIVMINDNDPPTCNDRIVVAVCCICHGVPWEYYDRHGAYCPGCVTTGVAADVGLAVISAPKP